MFNLIPFNSLTIGPSDSFSVTSAPYGNTIVLVIQARSISSAADVPTARLVDTVLACGVRTCNCCICVQRTPNTIWCCSSNCWRASAVTSLTVSPISYRSPSVRVVRSNEVFQAFVFFHGPTYSLGREHFSWVVVVYGSMPPSSVSISNSIEGNFYPSRSSSTTFCYSFANFTASRATWALAAASSFLLFSVSYAIHTFTSSFFRCTEKFSASTVDPTGVRHSGDQDSRTAKITSSVSK